MFSKQKRAYDPGALPAAQRLKRNYMDLWATNTISAEKAQELIDDAAQCGVRSCRPLQRRQPHNKSNVTRNLVKRLKKNNLWPYEYCAQIRLLDKTGNEKSQTVAFLLPHELLECLAKAGSPAKLLELGSLDATAMEHVQSCMEKYGKDLAAVGLWTDSVPCNWDRTESVEIVSIDLPGLAENWRTLRLPLVAFPSKSVGPNTFDDIMEVVAWSFKHLTMGVWPSERHDGSEWEASDVGKRKGRHRDPKARCNQQGKLSIAGCLCMVRCDWKAMKQVFRFPQFNELTGMCFICKCTPNEVITICIYIHIYILPPWSLGPIVPKEEFRVRS